MLTLKEELMETVFVVKVFNSSSGELSTNAVGVLFMLLPSFTILSVVTYVRGRLTVEGLCNLLLIIEVRQEALFFLRFACGNRLSLAQLSECALWRSFGVTVMTSSAS